MSKSMRNKMFGMILITLLVVNTMTVSADDDDYMMGGYGPGYDMGMMGGYGPGYGMMGHGMGMTGMGPGMRGGGYGYGHMEMMGMMPLGMLDLSDEQRTKLNKIMDDERKQHWTIMGKMMEQQSRLRDLYNADKPDPKKVGAAYGETAKLHQQMIEAHVQATNQMQDVLTKEQREQFRQWQRGGWGPGCGPRGPAGGQRGTMGPGNMPGSMMER